MEVRDNRVQETQRRESWCKEGQIGKREKEVRMSGESDHVIEHGMFELVLFRALFRRENLVYLSEPESAHLRVSRR